tara:strand:+ start:1058 stop:1471 length:414 start_codon:yes stop_codon:yes gene_type:complete
MEAILRLKRKAKHPFVSETGSSHKEAVLIVSNVSNNIIDKQLQIGFLVFNSVNDINKKPIDGGFSLSFDQDDFSETVVNTQTGEVIKWGQPSYANVLALFNIVDDGITLTSKQAEDWLLNSVVFKNEILNKGWELLK